MHEYSITCSIIEILKEAVKENNIKRIKKINFRLSPLSHIEPQSIEFYYNFLTKNDYKLINQQCLFLVSLFVHTIFRPD